MTEEVLPAGVSALACCSAGLQVRAARQAGSSDGGEPVMYR